MWTISDEARVGRNWKPRPGKLGARKLLSAAGCPPEIIERMDHAAAVAAIKGQPYTLHESAEAAREADAAVRARKLDRAVERAERESAREAAYEADCATIARIADLLERRRWNVQRSPLSEAIYVRRDHAHQTVRIAAHATVQDGRREYEFQVLLGGQTARGYVSDRMSCLQVLKQICSQSRIQVARD